MNAAYALNGQPCSREQFYAAACDPRRPVVVQACAGAGKTWMLVSRIVRALLVGAQPHEILAITFTKKAAGEMRERLQEWLHAFARMDEAQLRTELRLRGLEEKSEENADWSAKNLTSLLSNLYQQSLQAERPVQIRTFHSWFASLVSHAPLAVLEALGLPAAYELLEDDSQAVALLWPRFYERLQGDEALHRIYREAVADVGRWGVQEALGNALAKRVEFALADSAGVVSRSIEPMAQVFPAFAGLDEPVAMFAQQASLLAEAAKILAKVKQPSFAQCGVDLELALAKAAWNDVAICLLTQKNEPRKFSKELQADSTVQAAQQLCLEVQSAQLQHAAWQHQQRMAQLSRALMECFADLKRARGWVDMGDLERAALHLLSDEQLAGWVQQRLDAQIKHLLIDEFQDTNPLQWQALQSWLAGYVGAGSDPPSVFIVGDAKQSIYRFRRAEPQVFESAARFVCEGLQGTLLACDHTRRNAQAVVQAVNAVMGQAQQGEGYDFRAHTTESQEQGQVMALPLTPQPEKPSKEIDLIWRDSLTEPRDEPQEHAVDTECEVAARWVGAQIAQGITPQEIMVLARKRDRLARMRDALRELGIASQIAEKMALVELPEVQDVVALLDALVSPGNNLALAQALKSPLFAWHDEDLMALALLHRKQSEPALSWFDLLQKEEQRNQISCRPDSDFYAQTASLLLQYQQLLQRLPPHDALSHIYQQQRVIERCMAAAPAPLRARVQASLQALLHAALQASGGRFLTPHAWIRQLKAGHIPAPSSANSAEAVRLMTIHGAKGLEAHTVLLLDTNIAADKAKSLDVLVDWPGEKSAPQTFAFLRSESSAPHCVQNALQHERKQRAREEINALYVAMTRAKTQLAISGHEVRSPDSRCPWMRLEAAQAVHPGLMEEAWHGDFAAPLEQKEHEADAHFGIMELPRVELSKMTSSLPILEKNRPLGGIKSAQGATKSIVDQSVLDTTASRIGSCMHRLLELYRPGLALESIAPAVAQSFGLDEAQMGQAVQLARNITQGPAAWLWDTAQIDWQANEVELRYEGQLLRIDRLVRQRRDGQWWVLDYKSAYQPQAQEDLLMQLKRYANAVQAAQVAQASAKDSGASLVKAAFITGSGQLVEVP